MAIEPIANIPKAEAIGLPGPVNAPNILEIVVAIFARAFNTIVITGSAPVKASLNVLDKSKNPTTIPFSASPNLRKLSLLFVARSAMFLALLPICLNISSIGSPKVLITMEPPSRMLSNEVLT